jgi:hypothetical protein
MSFVGHRSVEHLSRHPLTHHFFSRHLSLVALKDLTPTSMFVQDVNLQIQFITLAQIWFVSCHLSLSGCYPQPVEGCEDFSDTIVHVFLVSGVSTNEQEKPAISYRLTRWN